MAFPNIKPLLPPTRDGVTYSPIVGMKMKTNAATTPGKAEGEGDAAESLPPAGAEVAGGLE